MFNSCRILIHIHAENSYQSHHDYQNDIGLLSFDMLAMFLATISSREPRSAWVASKQLPASFRPNGGRALEVLLSLFVAAAPLCFREDRTDLASRGRGRGQAEALPPEFVGVGEEGRVPLRDLVDDVEQTGTFIAIDDHVGIQDLLEHADGFGELSLLEFVEADDEGLLVLLGGGDAAEVLDIDCVCFAKSSAALRRWPSSW